MRNNYLLKSYWKKILIYLIIFFILIYIVYKVIIALKDKNKNTNKENFTPGIRQMYRPYVRNIRLNTEEFYNKTKNNINVVFRKIGFI
jgi:hypothetical protein